MSGGQPVSPIRIGMAGWSIPKVHSAAFPNQGSHLERYASVFNAVEINSSFYRPHRRSTFERWSASVHAEFRFAVKVPRSITHERRLRETGDLLDRFLEETEGLGPRLGPLLVQLPPTLRFEPDMSDQFLAHLRQKTTGPIVIEPRHGSWFTGEVDSLLDGLAIARVAADPAPVPGAGQPGGWRNLTYYRLHGSPRMYYSPYAPEALRGVAQRLLEDATSGREAWCIFDNTAAFAAAGDALETKSLLT